MGVMSTGLAGASVTTLVMAGWECWMVQFVSTPATLLADAFDIPGNMFGIPMDQSPLLTPVDMEGMSVNIPVDAFGIPEDVPLNSLDMEVDALSIPAEQLTLVLAADVTCYSLDALCPLVNHDQTLVTHVYKDDMFTMNNTHMLPSSPMHVHQPVTPVGLLYEKNAFSIPPAPAPSLPLQPTSLVFGDDAFVIPACIAITSVMPAAVNDIAGCWHLSITFMVCLKVWHLMWMTFPSPTVPHQHPSCRPLMPMYSICNACLQQPFLWSPMMLPAILCL